ncbi:MAG: DUF4411 family protein [Bryobacterales bacterium]|nr:DUF4411 family protein [Bryobacterales bacterium]
MSVRQAYLVDSDVFITAKNLYYRFDICPGFWKSLLHHHRAGRIYSIDRVHSELFLARKTEDLVQWVRSEVPDGFFLPVDTADVSDAYTGIMMWVQRQTRFFDYAKAKFARSADGWLVAYALGHGAIVVTNEQSAPQSKREVKLPDVCDQFGVRHDNAFAMLRALSIQFRVGRRHGNGKSGGAGLPAGRYVALLGASIGACLTAAFASCDDPGSCPLAACSGSPSSCVSGLPVRRMRAEESRNRTAAFSARRESCRTRNTESGSGRLLFVNVRDIGLGSANNLGGNRAGTARRRRFTTDLARPTRANRGRRTPAAG